MKKNQDFTSMGFKYTPTNYRYEAKFKDGKWSEGELITDANITLNESCAVFQYAQTCFEGLKAYTASDGSIVVFRPELNALRFKDSCQRLVMPEISTEQFIDAIKQVVRANSALVPPYGSGASLYLRPFMVGLSSVLGVAPATEYIFRVYASPVGPYFKDGFTPINLVTSEFDRAAPHGTGHIKAGLNYAMSMYAGKKAKERGYDECLFLDPKHHKYVEETKGANIIFVTKKGEIITPKSPSILPSVTRRSLLELAQTHLHLKCTERQIKIREVSKFAECGLCGTAAVISPTKSITHQNKRIEFAGMGDTLKKLYELLTAIQLKQIDAPNGWICTVIEPPIKKSENKKPNTKDANAKITNIKNANTKTTNTKNGPR